MVAAAEEPKGAPPKKELIWTALCQVTDTVQMLERKRRDNVDVWSGE
jgi:hypothetical protein